MKDDMQVELIQKINKIVNKIIRKLEITEVSYSMWNSYYNLLLKLIYNKVPTVSYYEFATALCLANVSFKTKEEEKMFIKQKDGLGKSISMAMQLSKTTNEDISFSLYNTTTLRESI